MSISTVQRRTKVFSAILLTALLAFFVKAVIPAGFMPENSGGFAKMVICSGMGEKTVFVPADDENSGHKQKDNICDYQMLANSKAIDAPPYTLIPSVVFATIENALRNELVSHQSSIFSFDARGPPSA